MRNRIQTIQVNGKRQIVKNWCSWLGAKGVAVKTATENPKHAKYAITKSLRCSVNV